METHAKDGTKLAFRTIGRGPQSVVLVHGWMMSGAVWDNLLEVLDTSELTLFVPDLRGSGASGAPAAGYTLGDYADDVLRVIAASGAQGPVVVGHSMGGQIAQLLAVEDPRAIGGLFLLNPVPASGLPLPDDARDLFGSCAKDVEKLGAILDIATKELGADARSRLLDVALTVSEACISQSLEAWTRGGFTERLGAISVPTRVVGSDDDFLPEAFLWEAVTAKIAGATQLQLPGPGHYPQVERPADVAAALTSFLAERRAADA